MHDLRARTREGMQVAKAKGRLCRRKPKLNPRQESHLVKLQASYDSLLDYRPTRSAHRGIGDGLRR